MLKLRNVPFNIKLINNDRSILNRLVMIDSLSLLDNRSSDFAPSGLYSSLIFGPKGSEERDKTMAYIDLKVPVMHPVYYKELTRLKNLYGEIMMGQAYAVFDEQENDFVRAKEGFLDGRTGMSFFYEYFDRLVYKQGDSKARQLRIQVLEKYRAVAWTTYLLVVPAGMRDVDFDENDRPVEEDINPMYRRVISAANTVNQNIPDKNHELLDGPRRSMQLAVNAISEYILDMMAGKKGIISGKFASRRVFATTRNVISAMETGSSELGSPDQPHLKTTIVGLFQFSKGVEPLLLRYQIKQDFLKEFFETLDGTVDLINPKTLKTETALLTNKSRDKWGTVDGLGKLLGAYLEISVRHKPVTIDGKYLKLVYQDDKYFRVMSSIDELPKDKDASKVRPMTWTELFYLHAEKIISRVRCFNTRYPITGVDSVYPSEPYVKTTTVGLQLQELDQDWRPTDRKVLEFPKTVEAFPFHEAMVIHPAFLPGLNADYDGDMLSCNFVWSVEAVATVDEYLNSWKTYLSPSGGLRYSTSDDTLEWVYSFMTDADPVE